MSLAIITTHLDVLNFIRKDFLDSPYNFTGELDFKNTSDVMISVDDLPGVIGINRVTVNFVRDIRYGIDKTVSIIADVTVPNSDAYKRCLKLQCIMGTYDWKIDDYEDHICDIIRNLGLDPSTKDNRNWKDILGIKSE